MKSERSNAVQTEQGYEGRSSRLDAESLSEDSAFHIVGLGLTADNECAALEELVQSVMRQYKEKIDQLLGQNQLEIALSLIRHVKTFHPDYPLPSEWLSLLEQ